MFNQKQYDQARSAFAKLGSFKDASRRTSDLESKEAQYKSAVKKYKNRNYARAFFENSLSMNYVSSN